VGRTKGTVKMRARGPVRGRVRGRIKVQETRGGNRLDLTVMGESENEKSRAVIEEIPVG